jgi:hypothetical protein
MMDQRRAIQIYLENRDKFQGVPQSDAVNLIRRSGGLPATAPVEAAPAAPVASALAAAAPAPAPAPVPVAAPAPEPAPEYLGPNQAALRAYNLANPEAPDSAPAAKNAPVDYAALARNAAAQRERESMGINAEIERTTTIDPEIQELLSNRSKRYETELSEADKDRKQATWMAVAQAGMKMAQSQSPYFMQALASGMEAGIEGYSEAKAKAAEKKARLQDAKEDLVLKAKELRDQAVKDAINARLASRQGAAADIALEQGSLANIIGQKTAAEQIRAPGLENAYKQAVTTKVYKDIANDSARVALAREAARAGPSGGGGGINLKNAGQVVNSLVSENKTYAAILENPLSSKAEKDTARTRMQANTKTIDYVRSLQKQNLGMGSGFKLLGPA